MDIKEYLFLKQIAQTDVTDTFFTEKEYEIIEKVCAKRARELFNRMCNEENICLMCGSELNPDGQLVIEDELKMSNHILRNIRVCSNESCEYNKELIKRAKEEFSKRHYGLDADNRYGIGPEGYGYRKN